MRRGSSAKGKGIDEVIVRRRLVQGKNLLTICEPSLLQGDFFTNECQRQYFQGETMSILFAQEYAMDADIISLLGRRVVRYFIDIGMVNPDSVGRFQDEDYAEVYRI